MNNIVLILKNLYNPFYRRFKSLTKAKRVLAIILSAFGALSATFTSYKIGNDISSHFIYLGAGEKSFTVLLVLFTVNALFYDLINGSRIYLTHDDEQGEGGYIHTLSSVTKVYLINLAFALYYLAIPLATQGAAAGIGGIRLFVSLFSVVFMPMLPIAFSIPVVLLFPRKLNRRIVFFANYFLLPALSAVLIIPFNGIWEPLSSKAYVISTYFSKYYFPATFFENHTTNGSGMMILIIASMSAYCLSIMLLNKFTRK